MSAEARGWGPGWPTSRAADVVPLSWITGSVHKAIHELCDLLCAETVRRGYAIRRDWSWGYANRPIGGTKTPSNHSWGLAVDLNAPTNPMRRPLTTDMPSWLPHMWKAYGFIWGGDWTRTPDPMHYEFAGTPADARRETIRARKAFAVPEKKATKMVLVRIDNSRVVYQIVGRFMVAFSAATQVEVAAREAGLEGRWQDHVGNITAEEARAYSHI